MEDGDGDGDERDDDEGEVNEEQDRNGVNDDAVRARRSAVGCLKQNYKWWWIILAQENENGSDDDDFDRKDEDAAADDDDYDYDDYYADVGDDDRRRCVKSKLPPSNGLLGASLLLQKEKPNWAMMMMVVMMMMMKMIMVTMMMLMTWLMMVMIAHSLTQWQLTHWNLVNDIYDDDDDKNVWALQEVFWAAAVTKKQYSHHCDRLWDNYDDDGGDDDGDEVYLLKGPALVRSLLVAVAEVFKSRHVLLAAGPLVWLVDGDEAVAEVDEHPGGDHDGVHPGHPLHQHQGDPHALGKEGSWETSSSLFHFFGERKMELREMYMAFWYTQCK